MKKNETTFGITIIGALFFIFGFVTWLNGILIPFLQTACELNTFQASFVPFAFYIAYLVTSIPSSYVLKRTGFANGMALGLIVMALGSILFVPAALNRHYLLFLVGLFVQGVGLSLLQTASNPYVTILGPIETAARRMSIMGICNKVAGMIGILLLYKALFAGTADIVNQLGNVSATQKELLLQSLSHRVILPYIIITVVLIALVLFIKKANLPEVVEEEDPDSEGSTNRSVFSYPYLWFGIFAIFFYVGAEVIAIDYLIPYGDYNGIEKAVSKNFSVFALVGLVVGYFLGILIVPKITSQRNFFIINLLLAVALTCVIIMTSGLISIVAVISLSFTHAIMWPAIWPLSIHHLGKHTKLASAFLIMAISGGAVLPLVYGKLSDALNPQIAYAMLFVSYAYMIFFALKGSKITKW